MSSSWYPRTMEPSVLIPCSRQINSHQAFPIWTPAWPTKIVITSPLSPIFIFIYQIFLSNFTDLNSIDDFLFFIIILIHILSFDGILILFIFFYRNFESKFIHFDLLVINWWIFSHDWLIFINCRLFSYKRRIMWTCFFLKNCTALFFFCKFCKSTDCW